MVFRKGGAKRHVALFLHAYFAASALSAVPAGGSKRPDAMDKRWAMTPSIGKNPIPPGNGSRRM